MSLVDADPSGLREPAARAWFVLARCLGGSREDRTRALSLAARARERWATKGEVGRRGVDEVEAWIETQR